ncbi:hypothetical protein ACJMK2_002287 [Sinanodonta woodiana]|uniref:SWIM-type domain-containing protein n=1 Tax=Sinanodonta woodiana TaxID=1069815 RepID=A0ABD3XY20_SINWO
MRRTYEMFPEVLMVDGTYRVNKLRMPLYLLIVEDGYGQGRIVGFSLVANEKRETLKNLIGEFGQIHNLEKVKTVVVDKDQNEIAAVQKFMPEISIQLCKFHIMQAFARKLKKCAVTQEVQGTITQLVRQMVYAKSKTAYDNSFGQLHNVAPQQFVDYYHKNWLESAPMWCAYQTNMHINLGNTTNNRMESMNQKIKDVLHMNLSVPEAVQGLLLVCRASNYAVRHRSFVQQMTVPYRLNDDDEVVDIVVKQLTPYAANIVVHEFKTARSQTERYACTPEKCCVLKTTMGLPCRHIFATRMKKQMRLSF